MSHPLLRKTALLAGLASFHILTACNGTLPLTPALNSSPPSAGEEQSFNFPGPDEDSETAPAEQQATTFSSDKDFGIAAEGTGSLTLITGNSRVTLSLNFMTRLKALAADHVLNKDEFTQLGQNATSDENTFLGLLQNSPWVSMPNLVTAPDEAATLNFMTFPRLNLGGAFLQQMHALGSDGVLNGSEIETLNATAVADEKRYLADQLVYDQLINFPLLNQAGQIVTLTLKTYYDEPETIPGEAAPAWVGRIGQGDRLSQTSTDSYRCFAGAVVNYVLLSKGMNGFQHLAGSLQTPAGSLSYQNLHLLQDALYRATGARPGGLSYSANTRTGQITGGTAVTAIRLAGVEMAPALLGRVSGSYQSSAKSFFEKQPQGALIASVNLNTSTGKLTFNTAFNHAVLITRSNGSYYVSDSGQRNGTGLNHRPLTSGEQTQWFSKNNPNPVLQLISAN